MFKDNGEVIHFTNPKVQASLASNTFAISGASDTKCKSVYFFFLLMFCFRGIALQDMLPTIMSQMGMTADSAFGSEAGRRKAGSHGEQQTGGDQIGTINEQEGDDEVPGMLILFKNIIHMFSFFKDLVENFDDVSNSK